MHKFTTLLAISLTALPHTHTLHIHTADSQPSPVITLPIQLNHHAGHRVLSPRNDHTRRTLQAATASATYTLGGCYQTDFTVLASIGATNKQGPYNLIVDTGSTTLGVVGSACPTGQSADGTCYNTQPVYTPTHIPTQASIDATYGSGGWHGAVYTDAVSIGSSTAVSMRFGVITRNYATESDGSTSGPFFNEGTGGNCLASASSTMPPATQGILGLGYAALAETGTDSWFDMYVAATGAANMFSINVLTKQITIGGFSGNSSQMVSVPVNTASGQGYYTVYASDISVGGTSVGASASSFPYGTIVDSGTNMIFLPSKLYSTVSQQIMSNKYFQSNFPSNFFDPNANNNCISQCDNNGNNCVTQDDINNNLPTLGMTFTDQYGNNAQTVHIAAAPGYIFPVQATLNNQAITAWCSGITPTSAQAIVGLPFMTQFEVVFNKQQNTVGFIPTTCASCQTGNPSGSSSFNYIPVVAGVVGGLAAAAILYIVIKKCVLEKRKQAGTDNRPAEVRYFTGQGNVLGGASQPPVAVAMPVQMAQPATANAAAARAAQQRQQLAQQQNLQYAAPSALSPPSAALSPQAVYAVSPQAAYAISPQQGRPMAASPVNGQWQTYYTPDNTPYYYNSFTGETVWELPR